MMEAPNGEKDMKRLKVIVVAGLMMAFALGAFAQDRAARTSIGWRGDGSGVYQKAEPPIHWQRVSKAVAALRVQAEPPKDEEPSGQPMPDGVIRE